MTPLLEVALAEPPAGIDGEHLAGHRRPRCEQRHLVGDEPVIAAGISVHSAAALS
ncbi:MAG: hypothetical protein ACRDXC_02765 [Acidimicrobiales bacterium]